MLPIVSILYHVFCASGVLKKVIEKCVDGASCREISDFGDELIIEECGKVFKKEKELKRGEFLWILSVTLYTVHY